MDVARAKWEIPVVFPGLDQPLDQRARRALWSVLGEPGEACADGERWSVRRHDHGGGFDVLLKSAADGGSVEILVLVGPHRVYSVRAVNGEELSDGLQIVELIVRPMPTGPAG